MPCNAHVSHKEKETPRAQTLHWHFILIALEYVSPQGDTTARPLRVIEMRRIRVILYIPSFRSLPPHRLKDNHIALKFAARSKYLSFCSSRPCACASSFHLSAAFAVSCRGGKEKKKKKEVFLKLWDSSTKRITAFSFLSRVMFISFRAGISEGEKNTPPYFFCWDLHCEKMQI